MQISVGIILGARCMDDVGKAGKDDLISDFIKNPVEEAQLGSCSSGIFIDPKIYFFKKSLLKKPSLPLPQSF